VVALGEMGLDSSATSRPAMRRETVLRRQLDMARRLEAGRHPAATPIRESSFLADERVGEVGGVMHCFSADLEVAKRCLDLGLTISLAGPVTYKNARALPEVARFVPADRLVLETDCPFLPPHPHRGQRNEPAWVAIIAARVAELRGVSPEALGETTTESALRLFRINRR
jgi:TatD DNase family protein